MIQKIPRMRRELIPCFGGSGGSPFEWRTAIMPQCVHWNAAAIVGRDDSHQQGSPSLHPLTDSTVQCVVLCLWRHATVSIAYDPGAESWGQDNEKDDSRVPQLLRPSSAQLWLGIFNTL